MTNYINVNDIEKLIKDGKIKHIFIDYDEVMVKSIKAVLDQLNERYNTAYITGDCTTWNMNNLFSNLSEIELLEIFDSVRFFDEVEMYEGVYEFINKYFDMITVVSKGLDTNLYLKKLWLDKYFPTIDFIGLEGTVMDKSMVKMGLNTVHIDDNQSNLWSTDAEYKILFENVPNAEWNKDWEITDDKGEFSILGDEFHGKTYYEKRFIMKGWE